MEKAFEIGKPYRNAELVARGALAEVYRAQSDSDGIVAIKRLHPHLWFDRPQREKFLREISILRTIDWPRIPRLLDSAAGEEDAYFVMEWRQGEAFLNFRDRIAAREDRETLAMTALRSLLVTLKYFRDLRPNDGAKPGLVHADLNPNNLLLDPSGELTVLDFSCAIWLADDPQYQGGTWGYMPVQQMNKQSVSLASDRFAAGALFAELLTGKRLLEGATSFEIFRSAFELQPDTSAFSSNRVAQRILELLFAEDAPGTQDPLQATLELLKPD